MSPNTVAVWLLNLDTGGSDRYAALLRFPGLLSDAEQAHALAYRHEGASVLYIHGRALLQLMLRHHLPPLPEFSAPRCALRIEKGGKPVLTGAFADSGLEFNISHSGNHLACALAWRRQVGIDIEALGRATNCEDVAARHYSPFEQADLMRLEGEARRERFFYYWTLKEAYLKARGGSIAGQLDEISFVPMSDGTVLVQDAFDKDADAHWGFTVLNALPGCQLALCWERQSSCFTPAVALRIIDVAELGAQAQSFAPQAVCQ